MKKALCLRALFSALMLAATTAWADPSKYIKAAEGGDAEAQYNLAMCYLKGEGVDKDEVGCRVVHQSCGSRA